MSDPEKKQPGPWTALLVTGIVLIAIGLALSFLGRLRLVEVHDA